MTEADVQKQEAAVYETAVDPEIQKEWANEMLTAFKLQEQRLAMSWRFHKLMRNDEQMQKTFDDLARAREAISVLSGLL